MTNSTVDAGVTRAAALAAHKERAPGRCGYEDMANWWLTKMYTTKRLNMGDCAAVAQVYATLALVHK